MRIGVLAEAEVARESDFGFNDTIFQTITHLGHVLKPGDTALGYDLTNVVMDLASERRMSESGQDPLEIILVKKSFEKSGSKAKPKSKKRRQAPWHRGKREYHEDSTSSGGASEDKQNGRS